MKALPTLNRFICYLLVVLLIGCLQQEIRPEPDQNTRACQLNNIITYLAGTVPVGKVNVPVWGTISEKIGYNGDGNPTKWTVYANGLQVDRTLTMEYDGNKLKRMNYEYSSEERIRKQFKTYEINANYDDITEYTFDKDNDSINPYIKRQFVFFRNKNKELRLDVVKLFTRDGMDKKKFNYTGTYKRFEYDGENRNVSKVFSGSKSIKDSLFNKGVKNENGNFKEDNLVLSYEGFDPNSRSPWNANFWLSFIQGYIEKNGKEGNIKGFHFHDSMGYWSENNLSTEKTDNIGAPEYNVYELNEQGFTCISSARRADGKPDLSEKLWYYNNCECRKR